MLTKSSNFLKDKPGKTPVNFTWEISRWGIPLIFGVTGIFVSTQVFAKLVEYDPYIIGEPLCVLFEHEIYNPLYYVIAAFWYAWKPGYSDYYIKSVQWFAIFTFLAFVTAVINTLIINHIATKKGTIHGTARELTDRELKNLGYINRRGVICGQVKKAVVKAKPKTEKDSFTNEKVSKTSLSLRCEKPASLICHGGDVNTLLLAPTGSGKGVGVIIPTLLSLISRSVVVLDPKGENFEKTSEWRSQFSYILKFNPASWDTLRFNPVNEIRDGIEYAFRDSDLISDIIFGGNSKGFSNDAAEYFANSAKTIVTAALMHIRFSDFNNKSFAGLRDFLCGGTSDDEISELLSGKGEANPDLGKNQAKLMATTKHFFRLTKEMYELGSYKMINNRTGEIKLCNKYDDMKIKIGDKIFSQELDEMIKKGAASILQLNAKEKASTWNTIASKMRLFDDPTVRYATSESDFTLDDFMNTDKPISLYLVVPSSDIERLSPVMKIIITLFLKRFTTGNTSFGKKALAFDTYFILDEFPILGNLPVVAEAMGVSRGYGVFFMIVCQALNQLVDRYGQNHPYLDHCTIHIIYAPGSVQDAELYSKAIGNETVHEEKISRSGRLKLSDTNLNYSDNNLGRAYMDASDILRIPKNSCLIRIQNEMPYIGKKVVYYQDFRFKNKVGDALPLETLKSQCNLLPSRKKYLAEIQENFEAEMEYTEVKLQTTTYEDDEVYEDTDEELINRINFYEQEEASDSEDEQNNSFENQETGSDESSDNEAVIKLSDDNTDDDGGFF